MEQTTNFIDKFHQLYNESVKYRGKAQTTLIASTDSSSALEINNNNNNANNGISTTASAIGGSLVEVEAIYNPSEVNIWTYIMIVIGCAFIIFVIGSIYLLCSSGDDGKPRNQKLRRSGAAGKRGGSGMGHNHSQYRYRGATSHITTPAQPASGTAAAVAPNNLLGPVSTSTPGSTADPGSLDF